MVRSIHSIQMFMTVADELHFRRAAERLHMTQPPLSLRIKQLEESLGVDLFCRTTRTVQLTPAGKELHERAKRWLQDLDIMMDAVKSVGQGTTGSLQLGFPPSTMFHTLPRLLETYRDRHPQVALDLHEMPSDDLLNAVRQGRLHAALARTSPASMGPDLDYVVAARETMVLAMPKDHPLAALEQIPAQRLDRVAFIGFSPSGSRYFHELVSHFFDAHGIRPLMMHESVLPTILALVEAGLGIALVPASLRNLRTERLTYRQVACKQPMDPATLYCVWRRPDVTPAIQNLVKVVLGNRAADEAIAMDTAAPAPAALARTPAMPPPGTSATIT
ncbi:LysR family transcriptional regulator [Bordetella petrii]|nr:LysR family transcriptional regulator [Bordetella petrii]